MQKLIEWLNEIDNSIFALSAPDNELRMLRDFKSKATELLTKEREQIEVAFNAANETLPDTNGYGRKYKTSENYYNQTYKQ